MQRTRFTLVGSAVVLALFLVWDAPAATEKSTPPAKADGKPGRAVETLGNEHVPSPSTPHVPYNTSPPTSGPHLQWVAKWGVHKTPIIRELQVHNLEDGGVIVQYKCLDPCPDLVGKLEALAARYREKAEVDRKSMRANPNEPIRSKYDHLIVAPYPDMERQIALTAWGRIDSFDGYNEARIVNFIETFIGIDHHPVHEKAPAAKIP